LALANKSSYVRIVLKRVSVWLQSWSAAIMTVISFKNFINCILNFSSDRSHLNESNTNTMFWLCFCSENFRNDILYWKKFLCTSSILSPLKEASVYKRKNVDIKTCKDTISCYKEIFRNFQQKSFFKHGSIPHKDNRKWLND